MWRNKLFRRRGFGIHSPFAYRFVVEVINADSDMYYDYCRLTDRWQRLLYRVAVFLQPSDIKECGGANVAPALIACPLRHRIAPVWTVEDVTRLAVAGPGATADDIRRLLAEGWVVYAEDSRRYDLPGMKFHISHGPSIIFPWPHLPVATYKV